MSPGAVTVEEKVVRVVDWLRDHHLVEAGPSVRAALAMAELAAGWDEMGGGPDGGLERVALMAVPHRLRCKPGVDVDALVRAAVRYAETAREPELHPAANVPHRQRRRRPADEDDQALLIPPRPREKQFGTSVLSERALQRLIGDLLIPERLWASSTGPTGTLPARRLPGEDALYPAPLGPGERSRDVSVRHSLRAAIRHGSADVGARELRVLRREPTTRYDLVLAVDVSASMAASEVAFAVAACRGLAEGLVRAGQRVGVVAFAEDAVVAQELTRDRRRLDPAEYDFGRSTNIEAGLEASRQLLLLGSVNGHRRRIVLISDSEATAYTTKPPTPKDEQRRRGWAEHFPGREGHRLRDSRRAALGAARRCAADEIRVSVCLPGAVGDNQFARQLAAAGGGVVRTLDPSLAIHRAFEAGVGT